MAAFIAAHSKVIFVGNSYSSTLSHGDASTFFKLETGVWALSPDGGLFISSCSVTLEREETILLVDHSILSPIASGAVSRCAAQQFCYCC